MTRFTPRHCPNTDCIAFVDPPAGWFRRKGYYEAQCRPEPVPRCRCTVCGKSFSSQTFRHDCRDRKPSTNAPLLELITSGVGLRQCGRLLGLDIHSVQGKLRKIARTCKALHDNLSPVLPAGRTFLLDEEETFEHARIWPLTMPVLIERETWFVVAASAASIRRLFLEGSWRRSQQDAHERDHGKRPDGSWECVREVLQALSRRLRGGGLLLQTDEKPSYPSLIRAVFGEAAQHERTPGSAERTTYNPLFPINTTLAMTRDNNGRLRRESWLVTKKCACLIQQVQLFLVYRNYMRRRFNRDGIHDTPAKLLGLLPRELHACQVLGWRQDWGDLSPHPMSPDGSRRIRDGLVTAA